MHVRKQLNLCYNYLDLFPLRRSTQGKSFHRFMHKV